MLTNSQWVQEPQRAGKSDTRRRLLSAARALFTERGYHSTRPQDVARKAGCGHGTFYLHFADKRACFLAFVDEAQREIEGAIESALSGVDSLEERIAQMLDASWRYADENPGVLAAALTDLRVIAPDEAPVETLPRRWAAMWTRTLREGAAQGCMRDDYDAELIGHAVIGAILQAGAHARRSHADGKALTDNLTRFLVRALTPGGTEGR